MFIHTNAGQRLNWFKSLTTMKNHRIGPLSIHRFNSVRRLPYIFGIAYYLNNKSRVVNIVKLKL